MFKNILRIAKKIFLIILGAVIIAFGINLFYVPVNLLGGGITAIAILSNILLGTNIALVTFVLNIPILILGIFLVDKEFVFFSSLGMISMSIALKLTENIPTPSENPITCIIAGGVIIGVGAGIMLRNNGSGGGLDVISRILYKYFSIPMGNSSLGSNALILIFACYFLGIDIVVATIATIFISSTVVNYIIEGINYKRTVIIITEKADEIALALMKEFGRGVTITEVKGAYSGKQKKQMMCAINPYQTPKLRNIVLKIEPTAFVTITESISVIGGGFKNNKLC
ncbi:YitT family protein [Anaerovorax odorimutans]|uniref:YitT family protein n=1 Tax=Anaerovorax odorimutans TaxID=109327 RepID=UPI00041B8A1A|nr:YitT family protein [Anaerovorax odorimutans]